MRSERNVNIGDDAAAAPGRPLCGYIQPTHYIEDAFSPALKNIINAFLKKDVFYLTSAFSSIGHYRMGEEEAQVQGCRATPRETEI